jgi:maleylacetoacetate isomerase
VIKLYHSAPSSASFRVRIALELKGLTYESALLDLRANQHLTEEYRRVNPLQAVPALVEGGETLLQSLAIIEYLDETHPEPPLLPRDPLGRARVRAMALLVACDIHPLNNLRVLRYLKRELGADDAARDKWYAHWIHEGFAALEQRLPEGPFCFGKAPTLADVCLVPQVVNAQRYKVDLAGYPKIRHIFDECMKLPAFARAHPDKLQL